MPRSWSVTGSGGKIGANRFCRCCWVRHSPPDIGGVAATSIRSREASFDGADGVVRNGTLFKNAFRNISAILTTPSAPLWWLRIFLLMAQPPLLYQEGSCPFYLYLSTPLPLYHAARRRWPPSSSSAARYPVAI